MAGGKIIDLCDIEHSGRRLIRIWCVGTGSEHWDELAIDVRPNNRMPSRGDSIWWQGRKAMWTPFGVLAAGQGQGVEWDIVLERVGYSFDPRPAAQSGTEGAP